MSILALLLSCASGSPEETGSRGAAPEETASLSGTAAVYEVGCEEARLDGVEVPGISGAAVWLAEACGGFSCRPAYDSARRDAEVLHVSCDDGEETVRIVLVR